ncbi:hypothetical protein BDD12DRAFT_833394 [Trichophaea hybrida]|nr:hypothetical protein BDD12DRAFT_833394 [Trichophaea hybrida]
MPVLQLPPILYQQIQPLSWNPCSKIQRIRYNFSKLSFDLSDGLSVGLHCASLFNFFVATRAAYLILQGRTRMRDAAAASTEAGLEDALQENKRMKADVEELREELATLKEAIASLRKPVLPDVARIGTAVYSDLANLDAADLQRLDLALTDYRRWILEEKNLPMLCERAGVRMQRMLGEFGVRYLDHGGEIRRTDGYSMFEDQSRSGSSRVYGLLIDRLYWSNQICDEGDGVVLVDALTTLVVLLEWRKIF